MKFVDLSSRKSLIRRIDQFSNKEPVHESSVRYTAKLVQRIKEAKIRNSNILLRNMQDDAKDGKLAETFFCDALPGATHTCNAFRSGHAQSLDIGENASPTFDYDDLALAAMNAGLIHFDASNKEETLQITQSIQKFQEKTLKQSRRDFERTCPKPESLDKLWEISLDDEMELFPHLFENYTLGYSNLRTGFDLAAKTSLCVVDTDNVLEDEAWQTFFKSLKDTHKFLK